jgi:phosphoglycolate phosphatase
MNSGAVPQLRMPKAILFDLDGTLVDSAPDITAAVNELLATRKQPPLPVEQVKSMIGNGVRKLVERAFAASGQPLGRAELDDANRDMLPIYRRHLTRLTCLMPGATEAVALLHVAGVPMGVATNKPQAATRQILLHFGLIERLRVIVGGDAVSHKKPAPDALLIALDRLGVEPSDALMVGDSVTDVIAARAAGMPIALVRGGYSVDPVERLGADFIYDSLLDLPPALQGNSEAA